MQFATGYINPKTSGRQKDPLTCPEQSLIRQETNIVTNPTQPADLHNHTTASDGALKPFELVEWAHDLGIRTLGITDHDTIDGLAEALQAARKCQIDIQPGMEITIRFKEAFFTGSLHLLAYFRDPLLENDDFIRDAEFVLSQGRGEALTRARIEAINAWFAPGAPSPLLPRLLTSEDIYAHGDRISRRHFALALGDLGIADRETVNRIIGNDSPAYVPSGSPAGLIRDFVRRWPLALVLAHPAAGSFPGDNMYREVLPPFETVERLIPKFIDIGLAGFEIEYPGHTCEWKETLRQYASRLGLPIVTGGSDCHDRMTRPLGVAGVGMAEVDVLRRYLEKRSQ